MKRSKSAKGAKAAAKSTKVVRDPNRALTERIFMTPSLFKLVPSPVRMIVGTLSHPEQLLQALGLTGTPAEG